MFSLRNNKGLPPFVSTLVGTWARKLAIFNVQYSGPHFGGNNDLALMEQGRGYRYSREEPGSYYAAPSGVRDRLTVLAGSSPFYPDEVEVFMLLKSPLHHCYHRDVLK